MECQVDCQPPWPVPALLALAPGVRRLTPVRGRPRPPAGSGPRVGAGAPAAAPSTPAEQARRRAGGASGSTARRRRRRCCVRLRRVEPPAAVPARRGRRRSLPHRRPPRAARRPHLPDRRGARTAGRPRSGSGPQPRGCTIAVALTGVTDGGALGQGAYTVRVAAKDARGRRLRPGPASARPTARLPAPPLPGRRPVHLRRRGLALRRPAAATATRARTSPPPGHPGGGAARRHGQGGRVPGRRRRATTWCWTASTRTATTCSCTCAPARSPCARARPCAPASDRRGGQHGPLFGAHLHFEIWTGGGWYTGGHPIDPLPYLRAWPR